MRVKMRVHIGGFHDGQEWPAAGGELDVSDDEGERLITSGNAEAVDETPDESELDVSDDEHSHKAPRKAAAKR